MSQPTPSNDPVDAAGVPPRHPESTSSVPSPPTPSPTERAATARRDHADQGNYMTHVGRPIVPTVVALATMLVTAYIAVSTIDHLVNGGEMSVRGVGFPLLLALISVLATAFAALRWAQRLRYVASTTPEEPAHARRTPRPTTSGLSSTRSELDYGERVDGGDQ